MVSNFTVMKNNVGGQLSSRAPSLRVRALSHVDSQNPESWIRFTILWIHDGDSVQSPFFSFFKIFLKAENRRFLKGH